MSEPTISEDFVKYNGAYYILGDGHKDFVADKHEDEDNYVLTLAAIAKELKARGLHTAKIHLAVGLPLNGCRHSERILEPISYRTDTLIIATQVKDM